RSVGDVAASVGIGRQSLVASAQGTRGGGADAARRRRLRSASAMGQWATSARLLRGAAARWARGARGDLVTPRLRDRLAAPLVAVYWLALLTGLLVYSLARPEPESAAALWAGAIGGTALGQVLALRNLRGWFAALIVGGVALVLAPMLAAGGASTLLWQAF